MHLFILNQELKWGLPSTSTLILFWIYSSFCRLPPAFTATTYSRVNGQPEIMKTNKNLELKLTQTFREVTSLILLVSLVALVLFFLFRSERVKCPNMEQDNYCVQYLKDLYSDPVHIYCERQVPRSSVEFAPDLNIHWIDCFRMELTDWQQT